MSRQCDSLGCTNEPSWVTKLGLEGMKAKRVYTCTICYPGFQKMYPKEAEMSIPMAAIAPATIINRSFEQLKCPNCKGVCLLPEVTFRDATHPPKERDVGCVQCGAMLNIWIPASGDISVFKSQPPYIYPEEIDSVAATGIKTTTDVYIRFNPYKALYECRVGTVIMGSPNFESMVGACPFDPHYHDNICTGFGSSPGEAVEVMRKDMIKMADALWA
jgi:hypothetical protein